MTRATSMVNIGSHGSTVATPVAQSGHPCSKAKLSPPSETTSVRPSVVGATWPTTRVLTLDALIWMSSFLFITNGSPGISGKRYRYFRCNESVGLRRVKVPPFDKKGVTRTHACFQTHRRPRRDQRCRSSIHLVLQSTWFARWRSAGGREVLQVVISYRRQE